MRASLRSLASENSRVLTWLWLNCIGQLETLSHHKHWPWQKIEDTSICMGCCMGMMISTEMWQDTFSSTSSYSIDVEENRPLNYLGRLGLVAYFAYNANF